MLQTKSVTRKSSAKRVEKNEIYNIKVTAFTNSIDTNDGKRDFHLKGMEFFQATNYPFRLIGLSRVREFILPYNRVRCHTANQNCVRLFGTQSYRLA